MYLSEKEGYGVLGLFACIVEVTMGDSCKPNLLEKFSELGKSSSDGKVLEG